jgi:Zn-dependent metalloprotease
MSYHAETGKVRFIGVSPDRSIAQPSVLGTDASPEEAGRAFLTTYGQLFGLKDQAQELTVIREKAADRGRSFVRFQQVYQGIPVLGGELIVQLDAGKNAISANGEILPVLELDTVPGVDAEMARQRALAKVAKDYGLSVNDLTTTEPELWIYNPILLGGPGPHLTALVWRMDVSSVELAPISELVLVDAHLGIVALHFNEIDAAKNRLIYDNNNAWTLGLPGNGPVRTEGQAPTGIIDVDNAYDYAGFTYDFYWNQHGRDSIDDAGMSLVSTTRYCPPKPSPCPYENAFWNGSQMVYGQGFSSADDVVAHELTHGVTQRESDLFPYMQSGAIHESFSDLWGEFVDLTYTNGNDDDSASVRWLMGEDVPVIGAFRDMENPPAFDDPDRIGSSYYYCGEADSGGVHTNSGVNNKAAYLMVDGGTFNDYTVSGIGIDKIAKIYYEVQTNMFTSAGDYQDLYDSLYQACINLIGTSGITAADCQEVRDATLATEMNQQPTSCPVTEAPFCLSGQSPSILFLDDFESGTGNWASAAIVGNDEWYLAGDYSTSGTYHLFGNGQPSTADYYASMAVDVSLPSGNTPYLHFDHAYAFEDNETTMYDGGVLEYSTNGGSSWNDAGSLFIDNGYDGTISTCCGNPLGGRSAFGGESNGYFSSRLELSSLAEQSVRFRFRIGTDNKSAAYGWFIDDVRIYTCLGGGEPGAETKVFLPIILRNH